MTEQSKDEILADVAYWQELEKALGWRLIGFTFRETATFIDNFDDDIHLTANQKNDLMNHLK